MIASLKHRPNALASQEKKGFLELRFFCTLISLCRRSRVGDAGGFMCVSKWESVHKSQPSKLKLMELRA